MAGLFIELYLDEDVSILIAELLRGRGFRLSRHMAKVSSGGPTPNS